MTKSVDCLASALTLDLNAKGILAQLKLDSVNTETADAWQFIRTPCYPN